MDHTPKSGDGLNPVPAIFYYRGRGIRTPMNGFGDRLQGPLKSRVLDAFYVWYDTWCDTLFFAKFFWKIPDPVHTG